MSEKLEEFAYFKMSFWNLGWVVNGMGRMVADGGLTIDFELANIVAPY
jgi:hypothetical protein